MVSFIKNRLNNRQDSEHQQAIVKFITGVSWLSYLLWHNQHNFVSSGAIFTTIIYIINAVLLFAWVVANPQINHYRRSFAIFLDTYIITTMMIYAGEIGALLFGAYLFLSLGYGFRYGNKYLFAATFMSIISFSILIIYSDYWQSQKYMGYGVIVALFILSTYVSTLISKLYKAIADAKLSSQIKSQFLANMSHEIRTPLNGVIAASDLLIKTPLDNQQQEFTKIIHSSANMLMDLINNILDISKIEAGKIDTNISNFDLHQLINSVIIVLRPSALSKGLNFNVHIYPDVPFLLCGDAQHLKQVILNLVNNAIKFTEQGLVSIHVAHIASSDKYSTIRLSVKDTGIGIADEAKPTIFNVFTQADESINRQYGGTGLGTTISKQLVELMGGNIGFTSQLGEGSTFWIEIKYHKQAVPSEEKKTISDIKNMRILIVEPDMNQQSIITTHLNHMGIKYDRVNYSGDTTNNILRHLYGKEEYHVIFLNYQYLDAPPCQIIKRLKISGDLIKTNFILNCDKIPDNESDIYDAGYSLIIDNHINRFHFFRILHAAVAGKYPVAETSTLNQPVVISENSEISHSDRITGLKILVGEDNHINQQVLKNILELDRHIVTMADNGEEILDTLEKEQFDLIIMDMHMPVMDGLEATRIIRFTHAGGKQPLIIIVSADATLTSIQACKNAKVDAHISKPVTSEKILNEVSELFKHKPRRSSFTGEPKLKLLNTANTKGTTVIEYRNLKDLSAISHSENFITQLINDYLNDTRQHIKQITTLLTNQYYQEMLMPIHNINGSSSSIGAVQIADVAHTIYTLIRTEQYSKIPQQIEELKYSFEKTHQQLHSYLKNQETVVTL